MSAGSGAKRAYRGAELWKSLSKANLDNPEQAMWSIASSVARRPPLETPAETLYEVAIWALLGFEDPDTFRQVCGPDLLASAARRGHAGSMFLLAKLCLEDVPFAMQSLRHLAEDGNCYELAWRWLESLAKDYVDAKLELACKKSEIDLDQLDALGREIPEATYRLGLNLAGQEETRSKGIALIGQAYDQGVASLPLFHLDEKFRLDR